MIPLLCQLSYAAVDRVHYGKSPLSVKPTGHASWPCSERPAHLKNGASVSDPARGRAGSKYRSACNRPHIVLEFANSGYYL